MASDLPLEAYRPITERFVKDPKNYPLFARHLNLFSIQPLANTEPFIVGGKVSDPGQFPYQAALKIAATDGNYFCGGSLISRNYVLTAAHCADSAESITVVLGAQNIRLKEPEQVELVVQASSIKVHPQWNPQTIRNDIAVLKLPQAANLNGRIQVIKLPSRAEAASDLVGATATTSGWGKPRDSAQSISEELRFVRTSVISKASCRNFFGSTVQDSNVCASGKRGQSSCSGDSGGPLTIGVNESLRQFGVVSFGSAFGCAIGFPHVYTRVTSFTDFIEQNTDVKLN